MGGFAELGGNGDEQIIRRGGGVGGGWGGGGVGGGIGVGYREDLRWAKKNNPRGLGGGWILKNHPSCTVPSL